MEVFNSILGSYGLFPDADQLKVVSDYAFCHRATQGHLVLRR